MTHVAGDAYEALWKESDSTMSSIRWRPAIRARLCSTISPNTLRKLNKKDRGGSLPSTSRRWIYCGARERGVPRYCAFRRHFNMSVPKSFEDLTITSNGVTR